MSALTRFYVTVYATVRDTVQDHLGLAVVAGALVVLAVAVTVWRSRRHG